MQWSFALQDPVLGQDISDLAQAFDRSLSFTRNGGSQVELTLAHEDEAAAELLDALAGGLPLVRAWRLEPMADLTIARVLRFAGALLPLEENAELDSTLKITASSPYTLLGARETSIFHSYTDVDQGEIAWSLLSEADAESPLGVIRGTIEPTFARSVSYDLYRQLDQALKELSEMSWVDPAGKLQSGIDFEFAPYADEGTKVAMFNVYANQGTDRPDAGFGHGDSTLNNVTRVRRTTTRPVNRVRIFGSDGVVRVKENTASQRTFGLSVRQESMPDEIVASILDARAQELLQPTPFKVIGFDPDPAVAPVPFIDYGIGDAVPLEVKRAAFVLDATPRVDGIKITLDENALESEHVITIAEDA